MIYADSSALLKLVFDEQESAALEAWLTKHATGPLISSELARIEVVRASRRLDPAAVADARALLAQVDLVPLTRDVLDRAADVGDASLRSLDALHLASALSVQRHLTALVAYDERLASAARDAGLTVAQPA